MAINHKEIIIHELFPDLSNEQQIKVAESLARYIALIYRIHERSTNLTELNHPAKI